MDAARFDALARSLSSAGTRRRVVRLLAALPVAAGLDALLGEAAGAGRRRRKARHHSGNGQEQHKVDNQRKRKRKGNKGKGKGKGKDKDKAKGKCVNAGQTPRNGKRCCSGLVEDGAGRCARPPSPPPPPGPAPRPCAETCDRCCLGETCVAATSTLQCGSGGAPCAPCAACRRCNGAGQCVADVGRNGACCPTGVCQNGSCVSGPCEPCGPATCANGCCAGDVCRIDVDSACGTGGGTCLDCTRTGRQCQNGQCVCVPITCPNNTCGSIDDGCGNTIACGPCQNPRPICAANNACVACSSSAQCGSGRLCRNGSCFTCDVVCSAPGGCDDRVQAAIDAPGAKSTIRICPGLYRETITIDRNVTLIGAGSGNGAGDTILHGGNSGRVVTINPDEFGIGVTVALQSVRITGGSVTGDGGGIYNDTGTLTMTDCTVSMNAASGDNAIGRGGGIFNEDGDVSLTGCSVTDNTATGKGGGIFTNAGMVTLNDSSVTENTATGNLNEPDGVPGDGGGIYNDGGSVTLANSTVDGNFASGGENNCAPVDAISGCSE